MPSTRSVVPLLCLFVLIGVAACGDESPVTPSAPVAAETDAPASTSTPIKVMTQNMYPGTNLDLVVAALASPDPSDDAPALAFAIQTLVETDFPSRAKLLAREIAKTRPHAVGLQEVSTFHIAAEVAGQVIDLDFLPILLAELDARGLHYEVQGAGTNYSLDPVPGISYSQGDALLIDADRVNVTNASHHIFSTNIGEIAPGVSLQQGWSIVDGKVKGQRVIFVSTHPESNAGGAVLSDLRAAQVTELVGTLPTGVPTFLMGDFNDFTSSPMYQVLTGANFKDLWAALRPGRVGNTCCHDDGLAETKATLDQRIDYVFTRGFGRIAGDPHARIVIFGNQPSERIHGPLHRLWASDHAALIATLSR
ncbi:MAG TPA: endonuclease/exonuclease/phosphatase family protein [Gemmatimonadales bacterium]|jgi:endonuclease/exonuclease/phosphatase family metal-dependent hydrolase